MPGCRLCRGHAVRPGCGFGTILNTMTHDRRLAVIGLGYVGLPLAIAFVEAGLTVEGIDVSPGRVAELNAGHSPIDDISGERLTAALSRGLRVVGTREARPSGADAVFVSVPTPITGTKDPDLGPVLEAAMFIRDRLRTGQLIVLQSTTFPGTTTGPFREALEAGGLTAGRDFDLAFAPERVNPGDPASWSRAVPRLVGGLTPAATTRAAALLRSINDRVVEISSPDAAEMAKLLENTFRNVNIAFVNNLALLCERMGLDVLGGHRRGGDQAVRIHALHPRTRGSAATASRWIPTTCPGERASSTSRTASSSSPATSTSRCRATWSISRRRRSTSGASR